MQQGHNLLELAGSGNPYVTLHDIDSTYSALFGFTRNAGVEKSMEGLFNVDRHAFLDSRDGSSLHGTGSTTAFQKTTSQHREDNEGYFGRETGQGYVKVRDHSRCRHLTRDFSSLFDGKEYAPEFKNRRFFYFQASQSHILVDIVSVFSLPQQPEPAHLRRQASSV